jgi:hypothetical protein
VVGIVVAIPQGNEPSWWCRPPPELRQLAFTDTSLLAIVPD